MSKEKPSHISPSAWERLGKKAWPGIPLTGQKSHMMGNMSTAGTQGPTLELWGLEQTKGLSIPRLGLPLVHFSLFQDILTQNWSMVGLSNWPFRR